MSDDLIDVVCPVDGTTVGTALNQGPDQVRDAAQKVLQHQTDWESSGPSDRRRWLDRYVAWLGHHRTELADLVQAETGKPRQEAELEVAVTQDIISYYARIAGRAMEGRSVRGHGATTATKRLSVVYRPHQLVGIITPWNFPLLGPLVDAAPALAAGAGVLIKPSELTPLAIRRAVEGWADIGAPPILGCVTGAGDTGAALVDEVDYVQFTGSTRTGRCIAERAARRLIPYSLELGGKDAAIVLADADLERAANAIVWGAMSNTGQACTSVERVYVEAAVYSEFIGLATAKVRALRQGDCRRGDYELGPLVSEAQVRVVDRHVTEAVAAGARVLTGGRRGDGPGHFYEPTVLVDVNHTMSAVREETFGPTLPIISVRDADEAVSLANDSPYGLSATVWTRDREHGRRIAAGLEAGSVNINDMFTNVTAFAIPQSGWKQSGIGARLGGAAGMHKYCRVQAVTEPRIAPRSEPMWYPYRPRRTRLIVTVLDVLRKVDRYRQRPRFGSEY